VGVAAAGESEEDEVEGAASASSDLDWSGDSMDCVKAGTAWGSSMVDVAISSRRVVAASSLAVPRL